MGKLWVSSDLTDGTQSHAKQMLIDQSSPAQGSSSCSSGSDTSVGPYSFAWQNCEDYDVWYGDAITDVGHQRFSYDQGSYAGEGTRAIAYKNTFTVENGFTPSFTWYEFVRLRFAATGPEVKCAADTKGDAGTAEDLRCN